MGRETEMIFIQGFGRILATLAVAVMVMMTVVDVAEARRAGGGFGSRGSRTFSTPSTTRTAPTDAQPIDRTMTRQQSAQPSAGRNATATNPRPGLFGGFGRRLRLGRRHGAFEDLRGSLRRRLGDDLTGGLGERAIGGLLGSFVRCFLLSRFAHRCRLRDHGARAGDPHPRQHAVQGGDP